MIDTDDDRALLMLMTTIVFTSYQTSLPVDERRAEAVEQAVKIMFDVDAWLDPA